MNLKQIFTITQMSNLFKIYKNIQYKFKKRKKRNYKIKINHLS